MTSTFFSQETERREKGEKVEQCNVKVSHHQQRQFIIISRCACEEDNFDSFAKKTTELDREDSSREVLALNVYVTERF